jgi:alpha-glucosidase
MRTDRRQGNTDWWRGAVIYQIYPRSFADSNADGVGDLRGITGRLDHVASLGVDAIWISPFFKSPMQDFGYDVSDYRDVDPLFGNLADFDALVKRAHQLGLKVMIDQVLSHSSDQHPWFVASRESRKGKYADWYVWADPQPDGTPPNNWLSVFGGPSWQWEARRRQYYLHNFLTSQPDLNFHNPAVRKALLDGIAFWCERGVDGFRFDACHCQFHDAKLRSNPERPRARDAALPDNAQAMQVHTYDRTRPENEAFMEDVRKVLDRHGAASVGEIGDENMLRTMAKYTSTRGKRPRLHMAYSFALLSPQNTVAHVRAQVEELERFLKVERGWGCWSLNNHDVPRVVSRWKLPKDDPRAAKAMLAMAGALRGSLCIYQGEELGLPEAEVPFDKLRDPVGKTFWPENKGRDGCRTPMPWQGAARHAGFSAAKAAEPWLPIPDAHRALAVDRQDGDDHSVLNFYRRYLPWRRSQPALVVGSIRFHDTAEPVMLLERKAPGQHLLCVFNLGPRKAKAAVPKGLRPVALDGQPAQGARLSGDHASIVLEPWGAGFFDLDRRAGAPGTAR